VAVTCARALAWEFRDPTRWNYSAKWTDSHGDFILCFDEEHGGQPLDLSADLPRLDLKAYQKELTAGELHDVQIIRLRDCAIECVVLLTRAIFFNDGALQVPMGIGGYSGLATSRYNVSPTQIM